MIIKKIYFIFIILLLYQSPLYSKSNSFNNFNSRDLSKYFSGVVAFDNKKNSEALSFFNSSKILINEHDPYLQRYIYSLVLDNKVSSAISILKKNKDKKNIKFFNADLLLIVDSLKKNDFDRSQDSIKKNNQFIQKR